MEQLQLRPQITSSVSSATFVADSQTSNKPGPLAPGIDASFAFRLGYLVSGEGLEIALVQSDSEGRELTARGGRIYLVDPNGLRILNAHSALLRWMWAFLFDRTNWPSCLFRSRPPRRLLIPWPRDLSAERRQLALLHLDLCLSGLRPLPEIVLPHDEPDLFLQKLWLDDQIALATFFSRSCSRRHRLQRLMRAKPISQRRRGARRLKAGSKKLQTSQHCFPNIILKSQRR